MRERSKQYLTISVNTLENRKKTEIRRCTRCTKDVQQDVHYVQDELNSKIV